jgi:hypothetical protein
VRLDTQEQVTYPAVPLSPLLNREAQDRANRWLARFAPVLEGTDSLGADETRRRLESVQGLRPDGQSALHNLRTQATQAEVPLIQTLASALNELDVLETELRRRLGALAPGDPQGQVDLGAIQAKLAERAAEREVKSWGTTDALLPPVVELKTSPPNWAAAGFMGLFCLGWNSFTTIHAVLFIGGFWHVIGPFALLFLLFYSIFWAAGLAMGLAAFMAACQETITLEARRLTVRRALFGYTWKREYNLAAGARAQLIDPIMKSQKQPVGGTGSGKDVAVTDESGKEIRFASGRPLHEQEALVTKLNQYLSAQPG